MFFIALAMEAFDETPSQRVHQLTFGKDQILRRSPGLTGDQP